MVFVYALRVTNGERESKSNQFRRWIFPENLIHCQYLSRCWGYKLKEMANVHDEVTSMQGSAGKVTAPAFTSAAHTSRGSFAVFHKIEVAFNKN